MNYERVVFFKHQHLIIFWPILNFNTDRQFVNSFNHLNLNVLSKDMNAMIQHSLSKLMLQIFKLRRK